MSKVVNNRLESSGASIIGAVTAGLCSSLVGIGLSRFAFSPLIPPLVSEHWFATSQAAYLGAANLIGYVAGAFDQPRSGHSNSCETAAASDDADRHRELFLLPVIRCHFFGSLLGVSPPAARAVY